MGVAEGSQLREAEKAGGCDTHARASAISWRCPADQLAPPAATAKSNDIVDVGLARPPSPPSSASITSGSSRCALFSAAMHSASVCSSNGSRLSRKVPSNKVAS